jgi:hypothetical protein
MLYMRPRKIVASNSTYTERTQKRKQRKNQGVNSVNYYSQKSNTIYSFSIYRLNLELIFFGAVAIRYVVYKFLIAVQFSIFFFFMS